MCEKIRSRGHTYVRKRGYGRDITLRQSIDSMTEYFVFELKDGDENE